MNPVHASGRAALALAASALVASVLLTATPAVAATPDSILSVSHDGVTFTPDSSFSLFTQIERVVPGDSMTESIWVRNDTAQSGRLRLDMVDARGDDLALATATSVVFTTPGRDAHGTVQDGIDAGSCLVLSDDILLGAGESVKLTSTLTVDPELGQRAGQAGDEGAEGSVGFGFRAILSDASVSADVFPGRACTVQAEAIPSAPAATGDLAVTGTAVPVTAMIIAVGAIGTGLVSFLRRSTKGRRDEERR